tara:strand:- start:1138 stop:1587 length:450 start_codon:yes stop_codon:yes gene_type:complete
MPFYNYWCGPCEEVFDELVSGEEYQNPQECPSCGNLSERTARGQKIVAHGIGLTEGRGDGDKAKTEHRWMEDEIKNTEEAIKSEKGVSPYTEYKINHEVAKEQGLCKNITEKEKQSRDKDRKKAMTTLAEGMSDKDIHYTKVGNSNRTH